MAGQPEFIRAKRLKFFHTTAEILAKGSLELAPTTSLILHPTTNLIASPEGNMIFRTAASFDGNVSIGGNLYVNGTMIINATSYITDDLEVTETITVGSTIHGKATASIDGALNVTGAADITGAVDVTGKLSTASTIHGKATASIDGALKVLGEGTIGGSLHNKGNASIDGTLDVTGAATITGAAHLRSTASIDGTVNAAGGGNIVVRKKTVISYSDFTAASIEERVDFQDIAVGDSISELFFQLATPFRYDTGPATVLGSICRVVFGDRDNLDGFSKTQLCGSIVAADTFFNTTMGGLPGKGVYLFNVASNLPKSKVYTATTNLQCGLTASNFNVASLTQGAIYAYYDIMQLPQ